MSTAEREREDALWWLWWWMMFCFAMATIALGLTLAVVEYAEIRNAAEQHPAQVVEQ